MADGKIHSYKVTIRNKGYKTVKGLDPSDAFRKVSPDWTLLPVSDAFNADVCVELLDGKRKHKSYYKLQGKAKTGMRGTASGMSGKTREERFTKMLERTFPEGLTLSALYPNGYSARQKDLFRERLFVNFGNPYTSGQKWPIEIRRLEREMAAMDMLSALVSESSASSAMIKYKAPNSSRWATDKRSHYEKYLTDYEEVGGTQAEFDKFLSIQLEHFKRASVLRGVHSAPDGGVYNSIVETTEEFNKEGMSMLFAIWETLG